MERGVRQVEPQHKEVDSLSLVRVGSHEDDTGAMWMYGWSSVMITPDDMLCEWIKHTDHEGACDVELPSTKDKKSKASWAAFWERQMSSTKYCRKGHFAGKRSCLQQGTLPSAWP